MLEIGSTRRGRKIVLSEDERARHVHVLGSSGTGKSKLLEHMIRQDIARGHGLCLIDPHGTLADAIEEWCAVRGFGNMRRIHVVRPGDDALVPGFNPLRAVPGEALSVRIDAMVGACAQAWGVRDMNETPRLEKILRALFYALTVRGLTLAEGPALLRARDSDGVRRLLTENLPDPVFQITWDELNGMPRKEFAEYVESTITRLTKFLTAPAMRLVVGQKNRGIDFRSAMDRGEIVLVNLGARHAFSHENARVLGMLLVNDLFLTALGRDEKIARRRPFALYIDEAYDFLSWDIERILDQTRKFGLHAVLAHQRIGQLKERGEGIYNAVMGNTQTKIVLGGLSDDDAAIMAREIMRGDIDLERPKRGITIPVVVGEEPFWLESENESEASSTSRAVTRSSSVSDTNNAVAGTSTAYAARDGEGIERRGLTESVAESSGRVLTEGIATTESESRSHSRTTGRTQTLRAVREERPTQYYSLEESLHLAQMKLRNLPDRAAIVKRRGKRTVRIDTADVEAVIKAPKIVERFRSTIAKGSTYVSEVSIAKAEIMARQSSLVPAPKTKAKPGEDDFWHED